MTLIIRNTDTAFTAENAPCAEADRDQWREEAWRCFCEAGGDPDGDDARHLNIGDAVAEVKQLREDYDEAQRDPNEVALNPEQDDE